MLRRTLGNTGIDVSILGFGCAKLTATSREDALKALEEAYASDITHFDVARLYGLGWAEGILGEFLKGKRDRLTVTTKFGLQPPGGWVKRRRLVYAAKKVLKIFPPVVRMMQKRAAQGVVGGKFTPDEAEKSLTTSLRELGTDYVDMLLLHEAETVDAASEPLVAWLEHQVAAGVVRCVGIGSDFGRLPKDLSTLPAIYRVIQFNHNAETRNLPLFTATEGRVLSTHTIFGPAKPLQAAAQSKPDAAAQFRDSVGADLLDPKTINSLLLHYTLQTNPQGMSLFSSTNVKHVRANALDAATEPYSAAQLSAFAQFVDAALK